MRMARVFFPQFSVVSPFMTLALAPTFSAGATESSRSRNTRSALLAAAFSIMRSLLAGVDNSDLLKRISSYLFPLRPLARRRHFLFPCPLFRFEVRLRGDHD